MGDLRELDTRPREVFCAGCGVPIPKLEGPLPVRAWCGDREAAKRCPCFEPRPPRQPKSDSNYCCLYRAALDDPWPYQVPNPYTVPDYLEHLKQERNCGRAR